MDRLVVAPTEGVLESVEAWSNSELVGGLYGVAIGGLFAGESMFHRATDASKVALAALVVGLQDGHDRLIDRRNLAVGATEGSVDEVGGVPVEELAGHGVDAVLDDGEPDISDVEESGTYSPRSEDLYETHDSHCSDCGADGRRSMLRWRHGR